MSSSDLINQIVLSPKFGHGRIVEIQSVSGRDFLVIENDGGQVKSYFPADDDKGYRFLSTPEKIQSVLEKLSGEGIKRDFESRKERVNYFKDQSKIQDLDLITELLLIFKGIDDLGSTEELVHQRLIDTIVLENSLVNEVSMRKSKQDIQSILKGAKK